MSFLRPEVSKHFEGIQSFLLWFQMAYAVWQFMRTAKFFRIPYVLVSSSWHGFDSWIKTRNLIMMKDELDVEETHLVADVVLRTPAKGMIIDYIDENNVEVSFDSYTCLTTRLRAAHMKMLRDYSGSSSKTQFGRDDDLLWPKAHLIRRLSFEDALNHVLTGHGYDVLTNTVCFFDYSTKELLNQNFLRFVSIWPLMLQARGFEFWSVIISIVIILMDLFSYWANKIWRFTQYWVSRFVKWAVLQSSSRERRIFLFTFMATISTRFQCANFVSDRASSKKVKKVMLATHIRFDKHKVAKLEPVTCRREAPRKIGDNQTAQSISYQIDGVSLIAKAEPALSETANSSVFFRRQNIKVGNWSLADMSYFLQICEYCDEFKFSPIKILDGNNALCCSFADIVQGVKTRTFVFCEFKTEQRLFFT